MLLLGLLTRSFHVLPRFEGDGHEVLCAAGARGIEAPAAAAMQAALQAALQAMPVEAPSAVRKPSAAKACDVPPELPVRAQAHDGLATALHGFEVLCMALHGHGP